MSLSPFAVEAPVCSVFPSGMKLVCCPAASPAEYFGVAVNVGSRDEAPGEYGLAHFVEHTIFKGTGRRSPSYIINRMEAVGGELNAFTSKEETYIYSAFPAGNLRRAMELIADLITGSTFPESELRKERTVVKEEIEACRDTPSDCVFDDFEDAIFQGSQLGHNILGDVASVSAFTSADCRRWLRGNYTAGRMTVFYYGATPAARVRREVERFFGGIPAGEQPRRSVPGSVAPFVRYNDGEQSHQANTVIGAPAPGIYSPRRHAMALLVNILGGPGMNSRLNVALRERRGLVYSVEASLARFTDCGLFTVYFGCDPDNNLRCLDLVRRQLHLISTEALRPRVLHSAKKQYLGQMSMAAVNVEQTVMGMARSMMYLDRVASPAEIVASVEALTADDLLEAAAVMEPSLCSSLTIV